ncbi:MAG: hypothetical protein R6U96_13615 [Promethearchaeia archaeon]
MNLKLSDLNNGSVFVGDKLGIKAEYEFEEDKDILWSGIRLITQPPCDKELQINKQEVFPKGHFEAGTYIRTRPMLIKSNVVPTIKKRDLEYKVHLVLRQISPINPDEAITIKKAHEIAILPKPSEEKKKPHPVSLSISGLEINLKKDVFKPGETIKINYTSEELREIEIRLLQSANLICHCQAYGKNCSQVQKLPPAIAGKAKTDNTEKGYLLIKVPEIAEPSHDYLWSSSEKEEWGFRYGDYSRWSLKILGRPRRRGKPIELEVPITIAKMKEIKEEELDLFAARKAQTPGLFEGANSQFEKRFSVTSIDAKENKYILSIKNMSNENLEGVTVKLTGLQRGLFETEPILTGYNEWRQNEEKEIELKLKQKGINAIVSIFEDNSQKKVRIQNKIS